MKSKANKFKHHPIIITLNAALLCAAAATAHAGDDPKTTEFPRENVTRPNVGLRGAVLTEPNYDGKSMEPITEINTDLPDLLPMGFEFSFAGEEVNYFGPAWRYTANVTVANFGKAKADYFACYYVVKVLETTDPVNWPVGKMVDAGDTWFSSLDVLDITQGFGGSGGFFIPKVITKAEVWFMVDPYFKYIGGTPEHGHVVELDEKNNTSESKVISTVDNK